MSRNSILVAVPCKLAPAMFSGERVFKLKLADGQEYASVAPRYFCFNSAGQLVKEYEPSSEVDGLVAAKWRYEIDEKEVAVEVPDGNIIAVKREMVKDRPTEIHPPPYERVGA